MRGRQAAWSDPEVQRLAEQFVPAADAVWRLQNRRDPECKLFQVLAEQGHYSSKRRPNHPTRQGIYAAAPSGVLLASINTVQPRRMARMLRDALEKWESLPREERFLAEDPRKATASIKRPEARYPEGGMALRLTSRDLPRSGEQPGDWRGRAWNKDYVWFRKAEAQSLLPVPIEPEGSRAWPATLARRLVRLHLLDNVRGQTAIYEDAHVIEAKLWTTVIAVEGFAVRLRFHGQTRACTTGTRLEEPDGSTSRGLETRLLGSAEFDLESGQYTAFELVVVGRRWGATRFNVRNDDRGPAPIGFVLRLAKETERVPPAFHYKYGW